MEKGSGLGITVSKTETPECSVCHPVITQAETCLNRKLKPHMGKFLWVLKIHH